MSTVVWILSTVLLLFVLWWSFLSPASWISWEQLLPLSQKPPVAALEESRETGMISCPLVLDINVHVNKKQSVLFWTWTFYCPPTKLPEGNVFTGVYHSDQGWGHAWSRGRGHARSRGARLTHDWEGHAWLKGAACLVDGAYVAGGGGGRVCPLTHGWQALSYHTCTLLYLKRAT